jgi:DNA adenine methylase
MRKVFPEDPLLNMDMLDKKIRRSSGSLLRYPGSKARLARFIGQSIKMNDFDTPVFVEPFCGGSSVSIALLESNTIREIVLNDIDPIVAALWKCVFSKDDAKWLSDTVMKVPLTLDYWQYQKSLSPNNLREAALKCLYLNRTSFSGVLHASAGPIGGRSQAKWSIGCRFNRNKLSARILQLSQLADRVKAVTSHSWIKVCKEWEKKQNVFIYLDPPFYNNAKRLYRFTFDDSEHLTLRNYLINCDKPWVLSYDNTPEIIKIYNDRGFNARIIDNTYSAHPIGGNSFVGREVIYSNLRELPLPEDQLDHVGLSVRRFDKMHVNEANNYKFPMSWVNMFYNRSIDNQTALR